MFWITFAIIWQANNCKMGQFGASIKNLREKKGLLQRQIAAHLNIDTPMLSKIERGERYAKKEQISQLAELLGVSEDSLHSLWLADKVYEVVKDEKTALKAIEFAEEQIKYVKKKKYKD
jgi:transcriptional regulator with XRE-family HTH domain